MLSHQWIYDKEDIFCWNEYSDIEVSFLWNYDVAQYGSAYIIDEKVINGICVKFYLIISLNLFILPNGDISKVFANRFVYEFECDEDPKLVEKELRHRRIGNRLFFGRFKNIKNAVEHADKRTKLIAQQNASDIITQYFDLLDLDPPEKIFDIYISKKERTSNYHGLNVDKLIMYNTYDNKFEKFYRVDVPFIRMPMSGQRKLFGFDLILDGNDGGLSMYFDKSLEPISESIRKIKDQLMNVFLPEIILTKQKYGIKGLPDIYDDEDDDYDLT